jgi:hypothetical protein
VRHVAIFGDDLEAFNGLCVSDDIVQEDWSVFLYPADGVSLTRAKKSVIRTMEARSQEQQKLPDVLERRSELMKGLQTPW